MNYFVPVGLIYFPVLAPEQISQTFYVVPQKVQNSPINQSIQQEDSKIDKDKVYWQLIKKQLQINYHKFQKKVWTSQEDETLKNLRRNGLSWVEISRKLSGTNPQVCKRRFNRIRLDQVKWSKEVDEVVIDLCQNKKRSWKQIYLILKKEFGIANKKKLRQIRDRYRLYLRSQISKMNWTVAEDLKLLLCICQFGRRWKKISKIFYDRTQLQTKNRYYGTLMPILKRVQKHIQQITNN